MGMSLYHMTEQYRTAMAELTDADLPEEVVNDTLEALEGELIQKGQAVTALALNLSAEIDSIKAVEKRISEKRKALEKREANLREYLRSNMERAGITEIKAIDGSFTAKLQKGRPSVIIDDESLLPEDSEYVRWKREPNKSAIAAAIQSGHEVPGAHIEVKPTLKLS